MVSLESINQKEIIKFPYWANKQISNSANKYFVMHSIKVEKSSLKILRRPEVNRLLKTEVFNPLSEIVLSCFLSMKPAGWWLKIIDQSISWQFQTSQKLTLFSLIRLQLYLQKCSSVLLYITLRCEIVFEFDIGYCGETPCSVSSLLFLL